MRDAVIRAGFGDRRGPYRGPIFDGKRGIRAFVTAEDKRNGVPNDPGRCALALGLKRQTGALAALVEDRGTAALLLRRPNGSIYAERLLVETKAVRDIRKFDSQKDDLKDLWSDGEVYFRPVPPSATTVARKRSYRKRVKVAIARGALPKEARSLGNRIKWKSPTGKQKKPRILSARVQALNAL